jgi:hypothetical protein
MATTFNTFQKTVTTSGTPVKLTAYAVEPDQTVLIKAKAANTGNITIGNTSANALTASGNNVVLAAGQSIEMHISNTDQVWIDASVSGEGVEVTVGGSGGSSASGSAQYNASAPTLANGAPTALQTDVNGNLKVTQATKIAGEDLTNDLMLVRQKASGGTVVAADTLIKTGAGFLHALTFSCNDAAPTAGSIIVYDNTAESGTQLFNHTFTTTPFVPFTVALDVPFSTGLYIGFTTTNDVNVTPSYI